MRCVAWFSEAWWARASLGQSSRRADTFAQRVSVFAGTATQSLTGRSAPKRRCLVRDGPSDASGRDHDLGRRFVERQKARDDAAAVRLLSPRLRRSAVCRCRHQRRSAEQENSRGTGSIRLVDAGRSAGGSCGRRGDALIAVGGVTALPAAPNEKVVGVCGLWSNGALGPGDFRSCPASPRWVRPIAAQAVSAAPWASVLTVEDKVYVGG